MYKIMAVLTLSACMATSAFAAGGLNSAIGGQSESAQTSHTDGDGTWKSGDASSSYTKLHHRYNHIGDKQ